MTNLQTTADREDQKTLSQRIPDSFKNSLSEIANENAVRYFGAALCLIHAVTFIFWLKLFFTGSYLNNEKGLYGSVCWSFAPWCTGLQFSLVTSSVVGVLYLASAIGAATSFLLRHVRVGWWALLALTVFKYLVVISDYRFMGNYHYMPFLMTVIYLFLPNRTLNCRVILVAIYFSAGLLKFNNEWLSGSALLRNTGLHGIVLEWLCGYVVILEVLIVFCLLAKNKFVRWAALLQFIAFHSFSYIVVGYFYPAVSGILLTIFPLTWIFGSSQEIKIRLPQVAMVLAFLSLQAIPWMQSGDPALVGRGRLYSLNMLDAHSVCEGRFFLRYENSAYEIKPALDTFGIRIHCDPLVFWNYGRNLCADSVRRTGFREMDFVLDSRRLTDQKFTPIVAVTDFCKNATSFNSLFVNSWNEIK